MLASLPVWELVSVLAWLLVSVQALVSAWLPASAADAPAVLVAAFALALAQALRRAPVSQLAWPSEQAGLAASRISLPDARPAWLLEQPHVPEPVLAAPPAGLAGRDLVVARA